MLDIKKFCSLLILIAMFIYSTTCLFLIGMSCDFYMSSIPFEDIDGNYYQIHNFIPLCLFTNFFNKKIYLKN